MNKLLPLLALVSVLAGCASAPGWKQQEFAFSLPEVPAAPCPKSANTIALGRVSISPLFQSRAFVYRLTDTQYEQDPYAAFLTPPERALAESIRGWLRADGAFGRFIEAGSGLAPSLVAEISVTEMYGDLRNPSHPMGTLALRFVLYEPEGDSPGRVVLDKMYARQTPLAKKAPAALMAAWEADLRTIFGDLDLQGQSAKRF